MSRRTSVAPTNPAPPVTSTRRVCAMTGKASIIPRPCRRPPPRPPGQAPGRPAGAWRSWDTRTGPGAPADGKSPLLITSTRPPATLRLAGEIDESNYLDLTGALAATAASGEGRLEVDMAGVA